MSALPRNNVIGVLVTFNRSELLPEYLSTLSRQTISLRSLVIVDNENSPATRRIASNAQKDSNFDIMYLPMAANVGSAGGWAAGIDQVCLKANDDDWVLLLDDGDPPINDTDVEEMLCFANDSSLEYDRLGGVGIVGARFDWKSGTIMRLKDCELCGPVEVDVIGSGHIPLYSVRALRAAGGFEAKLFFGLAEVELGLRLKRSGFRILANGDLWMKRREHTDQLGRKPRLFGKCAVSWRRYYVIRNYVHIMLVWGRRDLACRRALQELILKPLLTAVWHRQPTTAVRSSWLALRAVTDGFLHRMGRTVEPKVIPLDPPLNSD